MLSTCFPTIFLSLLYLLLFPFWAAALIGDKVLENGEILHPSVCPSVWPLVSPSIRLSVYTSIHPSVLQAFLIEADSVPFSQQASMKDSISCAQQKCNCSHCGKKREKKHHLSKRDRVFYSVANTQLRNALKCRVRR